MNKKTTSFLLAVFLATALAAASTADWHRDAVFYEVFVRSFFDSDGNGIGDLKGLTARLDYLNDGDPATATDLGVTALWLMPISESPSYHGYDVSDYYSIEQDYGTMEDFKRLAAEAHKRGMRVSIDLVLNHTSSQHPDFLAAADDASPKRDWYVWKTTKPAGWGQPWTSGSASDYVWHPLRAGEYYYGLFWDGMPDLNYANPAVQEEMIRVAKFWLAAGADGFRLDAIRYLIETGPGKGQMDTAENHAYLARFCREVKQFKPDCYLVGEIWTDLDTVATYLGSPQELDSAFNFDLAGAIVGGVKDRNYAYINAIQEVTLETYPQGTADAVFLTNHDMDRVASVYGPNMDKLKLAASVLLTLPGTPYIYYGEEIGMPGTKPDENIRKPMLWSSGANAGFSTARPWNAPARVRPGINVQEESENPDSLLSHYRRLVRLRNDSIALRRGDYQAVRLENKNIYAYLRRHEQQSVLVVHNFSDQPQPGLFLPVDMKLVICRDLSSIQPVTEIAPLAPFATRVYEVAAVPVADAE
ncbi:MAG: alpha-amylase family glycosyl hydrolase [Acidobacteriota bacterium]|nr:alpha-amylase family glycosyl hydrolase [Acidobacteriota bacterium]